MAKREIKKWQLDTWAISYNQLEVVKKIIDHFNKHEKTGDNPRMLFTRKELRDAHGVVVPGRRSSPYFITKNLKPSISHMAHVPKEFKEAPYGSYNLKGFLDYAEKHPPVQAVAEDKPAKKAKSAKKVATKKKVAAKSRKESKGRKEAPAPAEVTAKGAEEARA